jgi:hypothetical protein
MEIINQLKNNQKTFLQIIKSLILLFVFYKLGLPFYYIVGVGLLVLLIILLRGKFFNKFDALLTAKFPSFSKQSPRVKKLIIIIAFFLAYIILKQIIFFVLLQFGVDVQKIMIDSVNIQTYENN